MCVYTNPKHPFQPSFLSKYLVLLRPSSHPEWIHFLTKDKFVVINFNTYYVANIFQDCIFTMKRPKNVKKFFFFNNLDLYLEVTKMYNLRF